MAKPISIRADTADLRAVLAQHAEFAQKTVPQLVRSHARLCAVELALRTTPFNGGGGDAASKAAASKAALKLGENAVLFDIEKVIMPKKNFVAFVSNFGSEEIKARIQKLITSGNWQALTEILNKLGYADSLGGVDFVGKSQFHATHQKYRSKATGRTRKKTDKMHVATSDMSGYIKRVQKRVGMSKGGWAECARQIGVLKDSKSGKAADQARGIPQWAKRHGKGGHVDNHTGNLKNPHVIMHNNFPWASRVCSKTEQQNAVRIASEKMIESFLHALKAAAKSNAQARKLKAV